MTEAVAFVDRNADMRVIEGTVKNKFKWSWLEEKDSQGNFWSDYIRKLAQPGVCYCLVCKRKLNYANRGKSFLTRHTETDLHKNLSLNLKQSQTITAVFKTFAHLDGGCVSTPIAGPSRPYGAAPNVPETLITAPPEKTQLPKAQSMKDRVANQEAMLCSFIAEHSLPLSIAPHIIEFSQCVSQDHKALQSLAMERQTATYKLKYGLHELEKKRLADKLRNNPFNINLDESTTKHGKKRVLNVLVCVFDKSLERSVTYLYFSKEMTTVNAETVFNVVSGRLMEDKIPFSNLISILSDSAAYMRGRHNGFFKKMKDTYAPHLLDIDGDVCHHLHNISKLFSRTLDEENHLSKMLDDLYCDFSTSPDLREEFVSLCKIFTVKALMPKERAGHRWMSLFDCSQRFDEMEPFLILFYYSWMSKDDKELYQNEITNIFTRFNITHNGRMRVFQILKKLKSKNLTPCGRARKLRLTDKLIVQKKKSNFLKFSVLSIFPLFKNVILSLEQKTPTIHLLYDKQIQVFSTFLKYFVKPEHIRESGRKLSKLDLTKADIFLPLKCVFVGQCNDVLSTMPVSDATVWRQSLLNTYKKVAVYMQSKLPLSNPLLRILSVLDPRAFGQTDTCVILQKLPEFFPTINAPNFKQEIINMQSDLDISPSDSELDVWWANVFRLRRYEDVEKIVSACLSIFTGPRVEQSFSMMNNIIKENSSSMAISTYEAMQSVKYNLIACSKTSAQLYKRPDPVYSPIDPSLAYHLHTAASRSVKRKNVTETSSSTAEV